MAFPQGKVTGFVRYVHVIGFPCMCHANVSRYKVGVCRRVINKSSWGVGESNIYAMLLFFLLFFLFVALLAACVTVVAVNRT